MDIGARQGTIDGGYKPTILGVEGAGRILEVGSAAHGWQPGQRVARVFVRSSYAQRIDRS
jgi:NADPH2:quinone reductase